ncbi:tetratricopeptide repeat protein 16 [Oryzias melastigma]|uniref:tetratricopeptide repeat protein 16 n=1 Tax=Oryzias melastigma TaxID=30732 RepID=UPI000CF833C2|nr:tetratricopeptide repeat protein 16 [Oryzias melastigma]
MDSSDKRKGKTAWSQSLFSSAASEQRWDEEVKQLFGNNKVLLSRTKNNRGAELQAGVIIQRRAAEHCSNGAQALLRAEYERAVVCFSKAVTLQPGQPQLYVSQAEALLQLCDFHSAAGLYRRASFLQPGAFDDRLAFILYMQGQCLFDQGLFLEALQAFSCAAEVKPGCRIYEVKRLACLAALGRHDDCVQLLNDWITKCPTSDLHVLRARLHKVQNKTLQCYRDVKLALQLQPACPHAAALLLQLQEASEEARLQAVVRAVRGELREALCLSSVGLQNSPEDARLYLFRGTLYRRLKEFSAAMEDLVQAAELTEETGGGLEIIAGTKSELRDSLKEEVKFQAALTFNDFAIQCSCRGLHAEAAQLLNQAIEKEKSQAALYLNRGDCFFRRGKWRLALADYQQAEEMLRPDDPAVKLRLGLVHSTLGSSYFQNEHFQEAADMFSLAVNYSPSVGEYYGGSAKAFQSLGDLRGAREACVCMLILDPSSSQVPPLLMNLFPGKNAADVLSGPEGQAAKVRLMERIRSWRSSSDPQRD